MADLPTAAEIFAFAIFFIPGYLSLNVSSYLVKAKTLDLPWLEKVVVSYAWSLLIFLPALALQGKSLTADSVTSSLTTPVALLLLGFSLVFGLVGAVAYLFSLLSLDSVAALAGRLGRRAGIQADRYLDSTMVQFLKLIWENRKKNELIVETVSGRIFRGALGSKSFEPTTDILLIRPSTGIPLLEYLQREWAEIDEWSILIPQGNIRAIGAVVARKADL